MSELAIETKPLLKIVLPITPLRRELDPLFEPDFLDQMGIRAYDMMANAGKFEILAAGDLERPEYRCAQYVFATVKRESWADPDKFIPIFADPLGFFRDKGYRSLNEEDVPTTGDIISYGFMQRSDPIFRLMHLGIVDNKSVISKFNEGHVFRHPQEAVPHHFGSHALFFRK